MKRNILFFVISTLFFSVFSNPPDEKILKIKKIVIDAGHGGHDPGAVGKKYKEKDIALAVALKLGSLIKSAYPDMEVIYTRKTDEFIELYRRAQIANSNKADMFISIHCNSAPSPDPYGAETWVLGLNKSQANLEVAKKENASILLESNYATNYDGFDPNSPEGNIIFTLYQNAYLDQSLQFAGIMQQQFANKMGRHSRGVKQAGFLVLYKTTMPGALIEIGFISNPTEEEFIGSENGKTQIANGIFRAFKAYKLKYEGGSVDNTEVPDIDISDTLVSDNKTNNTKPKTDSIASGKKEIYFRVQFYTSPSKKALNSPEFKGLSEVRVYSQNNTFKYTSGNYKTLNDAAKYLDEVHNKGFKDAFVVAFVNEQRISPSDATKLLSQEKGQ